MHFPQETAPRPAETGRVHRPGRPAVRRATTGPDTGPDIGPLPLEWLGISAMLALVAFALWRNQHYFVDDAFITLRYARNLAQLGELSWNPGERVEGYTNFLHVVMAAGLMKLGLGGVAALRLINFAALAGLMVLAVAAGRIVAPDHPARRGLALIATGATPALAIWALGGLETVVVAAFLMAGLYALLRLAAGADARRAVIWAVLAFSLAVLTRMDSAIFIAGAGLAMIIGLQMPLRHRLGMAALVVGIPAAVSLAHMGWRWSYYGELLPLTFHAKTGIPPEARLGFLDLYAIRTLLFAPVVALGLGALVAVVVTRRRPQAPPFLLLALPALAHLAYVVWGGGDHFLGVRLLVPVVVPLGLILLMAACRLGPRGAGLTLTGAAAATGLSLVAVPPLSYDGAAFAGEVVGDHIAETWPEGSLVALHSAGATPWRAPGMRYIDMLGLNDPVIAHRTPIPMRAIQQPLPGHLKGDGAYVLSRRPDYIIAGFAEGDLVEEGQFLSDVELAEAPEFARCYRLQQVDIAYTPRPYAPLRPLPNPLTFTYYERICRTEETAP